MYQFYCTPDTYAMGIHILLEELAVDYELIEVKLGQYVENSPNSTDFPPGFLQASPHARVPALSHEHGAICESGAIALYLADTHADKGFSITPDHPQRAEYLQWLFYLSSTLQPEVMLQFHPEAYFTDTERQEQLQAASLRNLAGIMTILDTAYEDRTWLFAERPTAVDYCLSTPLLWPECVPGGLQTYPNLQRMLDALAERSAFQRVMPWHQVQQADG